MIAVARRGMRSFSITACTATVSVGETIAPRMKQTAIGSSGNRACATNPTTAIVAATKPIASAAIGRIHRRKSTQDVENASA
jgi:hypothetical protein